MFNQAKRVQTIDRVLPILGFEEDVILLKDGRLALCYEFVGAPAESFNEAQYLQFHEYFSNAFLSLPKHYIVQKIDVFANATYIDHANADEKLSHSFFKGETLRYFGERDVLRQRSYLILIGVGFKVRKRNSMSAFFSRAMHEKFDAAHFLDMGKRKQELMQVANAFASTLSAFGAISLRRLSQLECKQLVFQFVNFDFETSYAGAEREWLNEKAFLAIGDKKINTVTLQDFGDQADYFVRNEYGVLSSFLFRLGIYLQFPHVTVLSLMRDDTNQLLSQFDRTRSITQATQRLNQQQSALKVQELFDFTHHVRKNDLEFVALNLSVIVGSSGERSREKKVQWICEAFRSTYGLKPLVETFDNCNSFIGSLPGCAGENIRWLVATHDIAFCFVNPTTEFFSRSGGDFICDRFRNLIYIDLFNRNLNNQNALVVGPSGSGKSFAMGHFILQRFERRERQVIIDVGGTYRNIFEGLDDGEHKNAIKYFEYSPENAISFNPFLGSKNDKGNYVFDDDKANVLLTLIGMIVKDNQGNGMSGALGKVEWPVYEQLLTQYYQFVNQQGLIPSLTNFISWSAQRYQEASFAESFMQNLDQIGFSSALICFQPYTTGRYAQLLNASYTEDLSDFRLICFDMARVKEVPALYPIVSFLLIELSMEIIRKYPDDRKYVVMDEAWSMLSDSMGNFVEYLYRTIRKTNGSMTIVTQGVDELDTAIGNIIKSKCETKVVLNHSSLAEIEKVGLGIGLTKSEVEKVRSIRVAPDCRELFIKQGTDSAVYVLEVPPLEHAILTSNPVERNHLNRLKRLYGHLQYALYQWQEDKQQGHFDTK